MPRTPPANIRHELLVWARESIGYSAEEAAVKLRQPVEKLLAWEAGEARPTIAQLRKAAHVYKRPLAVFFLSENPPTDEELELTEKATILFPQELYERLTREAEQEGTSLDELVLRACHAQYGFAPREERHRALEEPRSLELPVAEPGAMKREAVPGPEEILRARSDGLDVAPPPGVE